MPLSRPRALAVAVALAAGCLAFGAKLMLVHAYGSDVPYMDEWDAVGRVLLEPSAQGTLRASAFLAPQNEHRVVLSRLLSYALATANRQWDPLLEMTVNAALHAAFCAALLLFARRLGTGARFAGAAVLVTLLFVLAFDWENTLQGFQSQFYLLEWGAFGTCLLCVPAQPLGPRWWAGWAVAAASLGTMSSGFMGAAAALVLLLVRCAAERRLTGRAGAAALLLGGVCAAGLASVTHVPGHDILRAHSAWAWLSTAAAALSWPDLRLPVAFLVLQLPLVALAARCLREHRLASYEGVLVAFGVWSWMQVAAVAYGRAGFGMVASPRYSDLYAAGSAVNILALAVLGAAGGAPRRWRTLTLLWVALFVGGLGDVTTHAYSDFLGDYPARKALERRHVRSFLKTGDAAALRAAAPDELPYPRVESLAGMLAAPGIRDALPLGLRPALTLTPDEGTYGFERSFAGDSGREGGDTTWRALSGPAHFVSTPLLRDRLPYLHFSLRGSPDLTVSLLTLAPAAEAPGSNPLPLRADAWRTEDIAVAADAPVRIVVDLPAGDHAIEFTEPVELGAGSWFTRWLLRRSGALTWSAGAALAAALAAMVLGGRPPSKARPETEQPERRPAPVRTTLI